MAPTAAAIVGFACEVAMMVLLAVAGWHLGGSGGIGLSITLAIILPVASVAIWSMWMAPRSKRRLPNPARYAAQIVLFLAVGFTVASTGLPLFGAIFVAVAASAFAIEWARERG